MSPLSSRIIVLSLEGSYNLTELEKRLEGQLPTKNLFYAIRIDGTFDRMTTRSVSAQSMPYPSLEEALENQTVSDLGPIAGTVVGFMSPDYFQGLCATGYHFHFRMAIGLAEATSSTCRLKIQPL